MMGTIRSEIMMPAASSPLAKLSQIVTDGIAKTAAEFASVIRTEAMVIKNANQIREGQQIHAQEFGVGAGDEEGGGYADNKLAGNKTKEKNSSTKRGISSNNNNNNNEWQNPDAALMHLMTDPAKLTALRNQREAGKRAQQEGITPETAQYLKSVLYMGGGSSGGAVSSTGGIRRATSLEPNIIDNTIKINYLDGSSEVIHNNPFLHPRTEWLNTTSANNNNSNERAVARDMTLLTK